jgi:hypothetical protein
MTKGKRPEDIEAEIAATRSGLAETLEALESRLAPRQLIEKGFDMMRDGIDGNMGRVGQVLKENPIPLALIGAGIGWLMLSGTGASRQVGRAASDAASAVGDRVRGMVRRDPGGEYAHARTKREGDFGGYGQSAGGSASRAYDSARDTAREAYGSAAETGQRAVGAVSSAAERAGDYGRQALDTAGGYVDQAGQSITHARDRFSQLMEDYPLAVGALGFLAGAVVAASLPATRWEDEHLGDARDDLWREAQTAGQEMVDRAKDVASTAASAATEAARDAVKETAEATKDEAERQGLVAGDKKP